jgi:hypothetical protein
MAIKYWQRALGALALALGVASCGSDSNDSVGSLRFIGDYTIKTKTLFQNVEFGGISGIDRAPDGTYWALSDERGGERGTPVFTIYRLTLTTKRSKA